MSVNSATENQALLNPPPSSFKQKGLYGCLTLTGLIFLGLTSYDLSQNSFHQHSVSADFQLGGKISGITASLLTTCFGIKNLFKKTITPDPQNEASNQFEIDDLQKLQTLTDRLDQILGKLQPINSTHEISLLVESPSVEDLLSKLTTQVEALEYHIQNPNKDYIMSVLRSLPGSGRNSSANSGPTTPFRTSNPYLPSTASGGSTPDPEELRRNIQEALSALEPITPPQGSSTPSRRTPGNLSPYPFPKLGDT